MAAWAEGMLSLAESLTYLTRDVRTPQDHSAPQAASLQSACSLGLYKRYFLMRTKPFTQCLAQVRCPARSGGVANKPDWVVSPAPWLFHCFAAWGSSLSFKPQFTFCVLQTFPTPCYGILCWPLGNSSPDTPVLLLLHTHIHPHTHTHTHGETHVHTQAHGESLLHTHTLTSTHTLLLTGKHTCTHSQT